MKATNSSIAANAGEWLIAQFLGPTISTGAYVAPFIPTAPANGSVWGGGMTFLFDQSSVTVDGL